MHLIITFLYILFILSAIVLIVVVLLQEGKGGGLTDALGSAGQQTFGVGAAGIHKFTGWTGAVFLASALSIHMLNRIEANQGVLNAFPGEQVEAPVTPPAVGGTAPATGAPAPTGDAPAPGGSTPVETPK